jgi:hypothetical protein
MIEDRSGIAISGLKNIKEQVTTYINPTHFTQAMFREEGPKRGRKRMKKRCKKLAK